MWCCENCAIAEGCLLEVSWPMKNICDVEVDTLDLPCPKLGCLHVLRCNPCCHRRRGCSRSYLACCTCISAWQKSPIKPMEKESGWLQWGATELRTPFFFQTPKRAPSLKRGRKKWYTILCPNGRFRIDLVGVLSFVAMNRTPRWEALFSFMGLPGRNGLVLFCMKRFNSQQAKFMLAWSSMYIPAYLVYFFLVCKSFSRICVKASARKSLCVKESARKKEMCVKNVVSENVLTLDCRRVYS